MTQPQFAKTTVRWLATGGLVLLLGVATFTRIDPDLWGHVRFGLDMIEARTLTSVDPYSFTQDRAWINHEWLSEFFMGVAWLMGGTAGLTLLKSLLASASLMLIWRGGSGLDPVARLAVIAVAVIGTFPATLTLRPQLWSLLLLGLLVRGLADGWPSRWWWCPVIFCAWANLHGGWIVGLAVLGVWATVESLVARRIDPRSLVAVMASAIATLATPYGWQLWGFLLETVRFERAISEWRPLWGLPPLLAVWSVPFVATVVSIARRSPIRWPAVSVLLLLAGLSMRVLRIEALFMMAAAILLPPLWTERWPAPVFRGLVRPRGEAGLAIALCGVMAVTGGFGARHATRCIQLEATPWLPDLSAQPWLQAAPTGRLVTDFNWGQYAIWQFAPRLRVSIDGRRETVYSERQLGNYQAIVNGTPEAFEVLAAWRSEYVWLPSSSKATKAWLAEHGYRIEFDGDQSFVAVREDLPPLAPTTAIPQTTRGCFPG